MSISVLVVDDEAVLSKNIDTFLKRNGHTVVTASSGAAGLYELERAQPDVVLLDYRLGDMDGLDVLRQIRASHGLIKVILMTGHGDVRLAVEAMKAGADEYLTKPLVLQELGVLLEKVAGSERMAGQLAYYQNKQAVQSGVHTILGNSPAMNTFKGMLQRIIDAEQGLSGAVPPAALITGETGTGKELVARAFHYDGSRRAGPFIELNCASIPEHLMEAELFGYEKGAFTDAKSRKLGLVETAGGGTLFLDEVGELQQSCQAKLLRLLETKMVRRLGGLRDREVNVRIVSATNKTLEEKIEQNEFRADLLFRLGVVRLELPPLRERGQDILLLAKHTLAELSKRYNKPSLGISERAEEVMLQYSWPGNVRELRNVLEQATLLCEDHVIDVVDLAIGKTTATSRTLNSVGVMHDALNLTDIELRAISEALRRTDWNVTHAADLLGISRDTLRYRMEKHDLRKT